jgi:hypothetical protein
MPIVANLSCSTLATSPSASIGPTRLASASRSTPAETDIGVCTIEVIAVDRSVEIIVEAVPARRVRVLGLAAASGLASGLASGPSAQIQFRDIQPTEAIVSPALDFTVFTHRAGGTTPRANLNEGSARIEQLIVRIVSPTLD